jgi:TetR/AcrR family transcriptional regulator, repressor for uid operon
MRKADPTLKDRRRAEIVDAATNCFMERGFHQTTMQIIAKEMGMSLGLLYRYFASKEEIIDAVAQIDHFEMIDAIKAMPIEGSVGAHWARLVLEAVTDLSEPKVAHLINEVVAEAGKNPQTLSKIQALGEETYQEVRAKLGAQKTKQAIPQHIDIDIAAHQLLALIDGVVSRRFMTNSTASLPVEALIDVSIKQILGD